MTDKLQQLKLALVGAEYSISMLSTSGDEPASPPLVSVEMTSATQTPLDDGAFMIPGEYMRVQAPPAPFGVEQ